MYPNVDLRVDMLGKSCCVFLEGSVAYGLGDEPRTKSGGA